MEKYFGKTQFSFLFFFSFLKLRCVIVIAIYSLCVGGRGDRSLVGYENEAWLGMRTSTCIIRYRAVVLAAYAVCTKKQGNISQEFPCQKTAIENDTLSVCVNPYYLEKSVGEKNSVYSVRN